MVLTNKIMSMCFNSVFAIGAICLVSQLNGSSSVSPIEEVEIEKKSTASIKKFADEYQQGRFTYISSGPFNYLPKDVEFGLWVTTNSKETIQSGRVLGLEFVNSYFEELQQNKNTLNWYECSREMFPNLFSGNLSLKHIGVRIAFWNENVERPKAPYLSQISFYGNTFRYYEANPQTQALQLVLEESYDDAVKNASKDRAIQSSQDDCITE